MLNWSLLSVFVPTFFLVSLTPGMCMTLAMTLGMTQGVKRTLWMMVGELLGVGLVAVSPRASRLSSDSNDRPLRTRSRP